MQKDAPYLDLNKHKEAHPYYNVKVPCEVSADGEVNAENGECPLDNFKRNEYTVIII